MTDEEFKYYKQFVPVKVEVVSFSAFAAAILPKKRRGNIYLYIGMLTLFKLGMNRADIARLYGISRQRVTQILKENWGL